MSHEDPPPGYGGNEWRDDTGYYTKNENSSWINNTTGERFIDIDEEIVYSSGANFRRNAA